MDLKRELQAVLDCEISDNVDDLVSHSHDASLFELKPQLIVYPRSKEDLEKLVAFVSSHKPNMPSLSLTVRSGGTDMGGGAINDSIIINVSKYLNQVSDITERSITAQPGAFYRDFEAITLAQGLLMPTYPASRELCTIGGMVANDSGGEKSLRYGKTHRFVTKLRMILRDGKEYTFEPLDKDKLDSKLSENDLQSEIYRELYDLAINNQEIINKTRPQVTKNSSGYNLWDMWDGTVFDPTKVIVGSQGTLGLITQATFKLVPAKPLSGMVVILLPSLKHLAQIINDVLPLKPTSMESFDEHTLKFAFRFFLSFRKTLGWKRFIILGLSFIPVLGKLLHFFPKLPKIIMLVEFEAQQQDDIEQKINLLGQKIAVYDDIEMQLVHDRKHEEKFWTMRRESFNLLRKNVKRKHTAPFIDDLIVPPDTLPQFLPELTEVMERYKLLYTVAGHMGDGNFHIIPLMDLSEQTERDKIYPVLDEVTDLILKYHGSLSGEHNDGLIRGPMLERMYGKEFTDLLKHVKQIFDPDNIFNPHKKTDADMDFSKQHIRRSF